MSVAGRQSAVALGAALLLTVLVDSALADRPMTIPARYDSRVSGLEELEPSTTQARWPNRRDSATVAVRIAAAVRAGSRS